MKKIFSIFPVFSRTIFQSIVLGIGLVLSLIIFLVLGSFSNSIATENRLINQNSNLADFYFDYTKIRKNSISLNADETRQYIQNEITTKHTVFYTFYDGPDNIERVLRIKTNKTIEAFDKIDLTNKNTINYSDNANPNQGFEQFLNSNLIDVKNSNKISSTNPLTDKEIDVLISLIKQISFLGRDYKFENFIHEKENQYNFKISFLSSGIYSAAKLSNKGIENVSYLRLYPAIVDNKRAFNLHLIKGSLPGTILDNKFRWATKYKQKEGEAYNPQFICNGIEDIVLLEKCFDSFNKEIVINETYALANNLKINDWIFVNGAKRKIIGIGEAINVAFPLITDIFPIPLSQFMGIAWAFDAFPNDLKITYESSGTNTYKYLPLSKLFPEDDIYGLFSKTVSEDEKSVALSLFNKDLNQYMNSQDKSLVISFTSPNFPYKTRIEGLKNLAYFSNLGAYVLSSFIFLIFLLIILFSCKSIIRKNKKSLNIIKSPWLKRSLLIFISCLLPLGLFASIIYFSLTLYGIGTNFILNFISQLFLNNIKFVPYDEKMLLIIGLVAASLIGLVFLFNLFYALKNIPKNHFLFNKKEKVDFSVHKKKKNVLKRKAIAISIFSSLTKSTWGGVLAAIGVAFIVTLSISSVTMDNYLNNYNEGKQNLKSVIYLQQPVWNSPITRYTIGYSENDVFLYSNINIEKLKREAANNPNNTPELGEIITEILKLTWLKDSYLFLSQLKELDQLNFPNQKILGVEYSYEIIKDLACSSILKGVYETLDKSKQTISSCVNVLLSKQAPSFIKEKVAKNDDFPFSFGRVHFDQRNEDLFTWGNTTIKAKGPTNDLQNLINNPINTRIIGLSLNQKSIQLLNKDGTNLFKNLIKDYTNFLNTKIERDYIPVVINRKLEKLLKIKVGDYISGDLLKKELILSTINKNELVYGVLKDINNNIVKTSNVALGRSEGYPDGANYNIYDEEKSHNLQEIVLGRDSGIVGFGWKTPDDTINLLNSGKLHLSWNAYPQNYKIIGITNNLDGNRNLIYALRKDVNKVLNYGEDWFSGKMTNNVDSLDKLFEHQLCVINQYGIYTQNGAFAKSYDNPLTMCFYDLDSKTIFGQAFASFSIINTYMSFGLYSVMGLIGIWILLFNFAMLYDIKKRMSLLEKFKINKLFSLFIYSVMYSFAIVIAIGIALFLSYLIVKDFAPDIIDNLLFPLPLELKLNTYIWAGGIVGGAFFVLILFNFFFLSISYQFQKRFKKKKE